MTVEYRDYFNSLKVQGPHMEVSTEWLWVGHVDEHTQVVPAPALPRGWALVVASPALAIQKLQEVKAGGGGGLAVFQGRSNYQTTVNAILADAALMAYNQEVQVRMNGVRQYYKDQIGLSDSEMIDLPVLFEDAGGGAVAYSPGVVNLVVIATRSGGIHLVVPDPEGPDSPDDVWSKETLTRLQALGTTTKPIKVTFVDVFYSYHVLLGEAHCGFNSVRLPPAGVWWNN
jgi:protein-arginine deiminase